MNYGMSYFLDDNHRGLLIAQRPAEIEMMKSSRTNPFISRVSIKEPIGLPPIRRSVVFRPIRKQINYVELKNKEIIKKIQNLKKIEKDITIEEEIMKKSKQEKIRDNMLKQNFNINEIRKELYGYIPETNQNLSKIFSFFNVIFPIEKTGLNFKNDLKSDLKSNEKSNEKRLNINSDNTIFNNAINDDYKIFNENYNKISEENNLKGVIPPIQYKNNIDPISLDEFESENNLNNLLSFVNNLDYEKYLKDLEIREALYLIKNKVEKEKNNEEENELNLESNLNNDVEKISVNNDNISETNSNKIRYYNDNQILHEKDWDNSSKPVTENNKNEEDSVKHEIAQKILKSDKQMRSIHSYNSVKKLLEREGFNEPSRLNTLKIAVLKEKEGIHNYEHKPSLMPGLRDLPII